MEGKKPGQPTKYKPEYCAQLIEDMRHGYSFQAFADAVDVHIDTLYEWLKVHPEFSEAYKKAHAANLRFWEGAGINGMNGNGFNAAVWMFNMKNRHKWHNND